MIPSARSGFQSLLWWIGCVNGRGHRPDRRTGDVSILVVVDWPRQLAPQAELHGSRMVFQSLLWWIGSRQLWMQCATGKRSWCFNPCCGGLARVNASTRTKEAAAEFLFQSLLWWIGSRQHRPGRLACRSIRGFNPCCGGLARVKLIRGTCAMTDAEVSILVVVDWLRQPIKRQAQTMGFSGFQSLLWWIGSRQPGPDLSVHGPGPCFNPCCGGLAASTPTRPGWRVRPCPGFNPCCGGLVCVNAAARCRSVATMGVSILVVVDWLASTRT